MKTVFVILIALFAISIIYVLYEVANAMPYNPAWDEINHETINLECDQDDVLG